MKRILIAIYFMLISGVVLSRELTSARYYDLKQRTVTEISNKRVVTKDIVTSYVMEDFTDDDLKINYDADIHIASYYNKARRKSVYFEYPAQSGDNIIYPDAYYLFKKDAGLKKTYDTSGYWDDYGDEAKDICIGFQMQHAMDISFSTLDGASTDIKHSKIYLLSYTSNISTLSPPIIVANAKQVDYGIDKLSINNLSAGNYFIYVEGQTDKSTPLNGLITVSITGHYIPKEGDLLTNAIPLANNELFNKVFPEFKCVRIDNTLPYDKLPDGLAENAFANDYGTSGNDIFYKFTITPEQGPLDVIATHKDQSTDLIDTYIYLLDAEGKLIESNDDDYGETPYVSFMEQGYIKRRLNPGTYYVVSEGNGSDGAICTIIEGRVPANDSSPTNITINNYIKTTTAISDNKYLTEYQYFDGIGKASELVKQQFTPSGKDLVVYNELDRSNKVSTQWLPAPTTNSSGAFVPTPDIKAFAESYYLDSRPFTQTQLEHSSFARPEMEIPPGESWLDHPVMKTYDFNVANEVKYYYADAASQLFAPKYYDAGTLHKTVSTDEDGKPVTEYKDKDDRIVMQRSGTNVDTYYVYNDLGQLVYVLPPLAADGLPIRTSGAYLTVTPTVKKNTYLYKYDERGNCIYKRLPGCEGNHMVYDKANRLVASQDAIQFTKKQWTIIKYDRLGRVLYTGVINREITSAEKNTLHNDTVFVESKGTANQLGNTGYTCNFFPNEVVPLTVTYYDDYNFPGATGNLAYQAKPGYGVQYTVDGAANAKGLVTGTRTYLLDGSGAYTSSVSYYDDKGFVIQSRATNHLGGYDIAYNDLDLMGNPNRTLKEHNIATDGVQQPVVSELYAYTYDQAGRPTKTTYQINSQPAVTLTDLTAPGSYDELGRVATKKRHNGRDTESLTYNVRGWTTKIKSGDFVEDLYYETNPQDVSPCYNGNISYQTWTYGGGGSPKRYAYAYDALNRLTKADYTSNSEYFTYDKMGNLLTLIRGSEKTGSRNIDQLSFGYNGNQVSWISDNAGVYNIYGLKEFTNKYDYSDEFAYDTNGNMTKDLNREIVTIKYNLLNLPELVQFKNGNQIVNKYDAAGQKLRTDYFTRLTALSVPLTAGQVITQTYDGTTVDQRGTAYVGNMEYTTAKGMAANTKLDKILNAEGYVTTVANPQYFYFRRDHLGTNREVWSFPASGGSFLEQVTQYYPSGLPWWEGRMAETQSRKFNGKEFVEAHGYDTYDYGARGYYPAIMRFTTVDPLAEKKPWLSPYVYCSDNPVNRVDPDGNRDWPVGVTYNGHQRSHLDNFSEQRGNRTHQGLDINLGSGYDDYGAPVYATHDGTVTRIATIDNGDTNGGGNRVQITSADGEVSTCYMHLEAVAEGIKVGAAIAEGVQIGTLGASAFGSSTGTASHLHYELRVNGELTNPAISATQLIDPQTLIATAQLPEVTVTAKGPNQNQQLPVQEIQIPEIKNPEEQK